MQTHLKKLLLTALLCLGLTAYVRGQYIVNGKEIDTAFNTQMNHIFGGLDKSRVPFGLLKDYALELTNLPGYNGTDMADSTLLNKNLLYEIYTTLLTARVTAAAYTTLPNSSVTDSIWYGYRQPGQVTLCGLFYQYAYLDANALSNNTITVSGNQYFDKYINGTWQNPYLTGKAVGFAPAAETYLGQTFNILLPASLWLSNSKGIVNHIEVDPGDGQGYRTITPDVPLPVNYADTGLKIWNFKLYLTDNSILQSHTRLQVNQDTYGQNIVDNQLNINSLSRNHTTRALATAASLPQTGVSGFYPFTSTETYLGLPASGYVTVKLAPNHTSIQKPLIIVEGFDVGKYTTPEVLTGSFSLTQFTQAVRYSPDLNVLINGTDSQTATYDLIYIDNANGLDYIQRNALLVKDVIRWVNSVKQPLSGNTTKEKNVVIGQSMGTLVARYALKKMEDAGETHDVSLYISHDGPQQGANVPAGFQSLVNHADNLYVRAGIGALLYDIVLAVAHKNDKIPGELSIRSTPAARQMIINYIDDNDNLDNSMHDTWQTELDNLGYPSQSGIRNIAISNGSECGKPADVTAGGQLFLIDGEFKTSFLTEIISTVATVLAPETTAEVYGGIAVATGQPALLLGLIPGGNKITMHFQVNASNTYGGNQVYNGYINYTKKLLWLVNITVSMTSRSKNAYAGTLAYDNFSGSFVSVSPFGNSAANNAFYNYQVTISGPTHFCFIPVPSALDLGSTPANLSAPDYLKPYGPANAPLSPQNTPFANFITARNGSPDNEEHITFETRNGSWLANELNGHTTSSYGYNLVDCSLSCINNVMTGPDHFCGSTVAQYIVPGAATNANIQWSTTGPISISGPTTGNQVSITTSTAYGSQGFCTLTALLHSTCGDINIVKNIRTGTLDLPDITGPAEICVLVRGNRYTVEAPEASSANYVWTMSPGPPDFHTYTGPQLDFHTSYPGTYWVQVVVPTLCGNEQQGMWITVDDCNATPSSFAAYPNPAGQTITITSTAKAATQATASRALSTQTTDVATTAKTPFSYKVYDSKGKIWTQGESTTGDDIEVNVSNIPNNTYILHIIHGDKTIKKQIIIQH
jgi:hypothetical protein